VRLGIRPLSPDQLSDPKMRHATKYLKTKLNAWGIDVLENWAVMNGAELEVDRSMHSSRLKNCPSQKPNVRRADPFTSTY
jgi:hypothetical protein